MRNEGWSLCFAALSKEKATSLDRRSHRVYGVGQILYGGVTGKVLMQCRVWINLNSHCLDHPILRDKISDSNFSHCTNTYSRSSIFTVQHPKVP